MFCTYLCVLSLALSLSLWNDIIRYIQMNSGVMIGTRGSTIGTKSALKWKVKLKWKLRLRLELRLVMFIMSYMIYSLRSPALHAIVFHPTKQHTTNIYYI